MRTDADSPFMLASVALGVAYIGLDVGLSVGAAGLAATASVFLQLVMVQP